MKIPTRKMKPRKRKMNVPFEPLLLWTSPHEGGEAIGLEPTMYVHYCIFVYPVMFSLAHNVLFSILLGSRKCNLMNLELRKK